MTRPDPAIDTPAALRDWNDSIRTWDDGRPSRSDEADEWPMRNYGTVTPVDDLASVAKVVELQVSTAARFTRCSTCNTSVDLEWDGEICDHGQPLCAGCWCNCPDGAA